MKNKIYTTLLFGGFCALVLFMTACTHDPIFYDIDKEIKLEEISIQGNVHSIVKLGDYLYTANGNLHKKKVGEVRGWQDMSKSGITEFDHVVQLASDDANLYALTAKQTETGGIAHSYKVWVLLKGTGEWKEVPKAELLDAVKGTNVVIFDNAVNDSSGRNAYVRVGGVVKKLNGAALGATLTRNGITKKTIAAAKLTGGDHFADTRAFCSDGENILYRAKASGTDEIVYTKTIEYKNGIGDWTDSSVSVDAEPRNFAFDSTRLLVGTDEGLQQVTLNTSNIPTSASDLGSNAEATIGESEIFAVATFGDGVIYAGASKVRSTRYNALWAFYPNRGNWNYE